MEQQKVFATAFRGFEKKAVLDYIYEQDMLFKKKEAEWEKKLADQEDKLTELEQAPVEPQMTEVQQETLEQLQAQCSTLESQLSNKGNELRLQQEINSRLSAKCETLEEKLRIVAEHLIAEREASLLEPEAYPPPLAVMTEEGSIVELELPDVGQPLLVTETAAIQPLCDVQTQAEAQEAVQKEYTDLKEELDDFRQQVSKTLLNFEAALARLDAGKAGEVQETASFFQ